MIRRAKIIISDTHIGAGGEPEGNQLEDFISDAEFVAWMHDLVEESNREGIEMEFIINGDWIEFLQIPAVERFEPHRIYDTDFYTDAGEEAALKRLQIAFEWHPSIFLGLADFLNPGTPRRSIHILFGNHDPELVYPAVQARLHQMLNAEGDLADLVHIGARSYLRDRVYIEHGNAYTEHVDRFQNSDAPFDPDIPGQIERPPGSHFVTHFFNKLEWERPWVDGVHPLTSLIFYGLAFEPALALKALKALLAAAPGMIDDLVAAPAPGQPPPPRQRLLDQLATPEQQAALARRLASDPAFAAEFSGEVQQILTEDGVALPTLPDGVAGAPADVPPEVRAQELMEKYWQALADKAEELAEAGEIEVILFGHIHERVQQTLSNGALYLNTGAWVWKGDFSEQPDQVWQDLLRNPEKYSGERTLTYARIDLDEGGAIVAARLSQVGEEPLPPAPPGPLPRAGLWTRLLLAIRNFFRKLFA